MASITKTKNGKFKATVYVGRDANGKQIRKSITCDTEKEAKKLISFLADNKNCDICFDEIEPLYYSSTPKATTSIINEYLNKDNGV